MFRSYLSAALRNLLRYRAVTLINITGLAVGFAAALLIALYVRYEHSYEQFIPGYQNLYRFSMDMRNSERGFEHADGSSHRIAAWLKLDFPEVEQTARLNEGWRGVGTDDREFNEEVFEADASFFHLFAVPAVAGDLAHALDQPNSMAISRSIARKYFGRDAPLGRTLKFERHEPFRITAVFEDLPANSHLNIRIVYSTSASGGLGYFDALSKTQQVDVRVYTYFQLRPGARVEDMRAQLPEFVKRHWPGPMASSFLPQILPIADIHLSPDVKRPFKPRGNPDALRALTLVAILIVFIAVINFVNLTTARAANRGIEVGVRKLAGARRVDLALQFMGESLLYVGAAMLLAVSLVELALPAFRALLDPGDAQLVAPAIVFDYWRSPALLSALAGSTVLVGIVAAIYPAIVLSSFRPAVVLKGAALPGTAGARVREWLVILQFAALVGLIYATTVIFRQANYALHSAARIDTDQVVIYNLWKDDSPGIPGAPFRNAVAAIPGVLGITTSAQIPTNADIGMLPFATSTAPGIAVMQIAPVDWNFFEFYRVRLLAGRNFERTRGTDQYLPGNEARPLSVIVNETAARRLGYPRDADAIGKAVRATHWPFYLDPAPDPVTIVGVVADFPVDSVRGEIAPAVYYINEPTLQMVSIRFAGANAPETLQAIRDAWKKVGQPRAQEGWLLDGYYRILYADIILQQKTLSLFAGCAVFLAALGLFGLSIYTAQRRTKEIGIRKVMGASTADVMRLLLWAFTKPVLWASLIAWPLAAWLMNRWLEGFAYRVPLGWWWLPVATLTALGIALATVSAHSYAVARQQPANALRYE